MATSLTPEYESYLVTEWSSCYDHDPIPVCKCNTLVMWLQRWKLLLIVLGSLLGISGILTFIWTAGDMYILGHDAGYRIATEPFYTQLPFIWSEVVNFGVAKFHNPAALTIHSPEYLASLITRDTHIIQQLVIFFWHVVNFSSFLFAYLLYRGHDKKTLRILFFLATIVYAINFFNLQGWGVFWRTRFSIQATLPLIFFYIYSISIRNTISIRHTIFLSVFLAFFNGGGSPPLYGSVLLIWFVSCIYFWYTSVQQNKIGVLLLKASGMVLGWYVLFSAYWLIPYVYFAFTSYQSQLGLLGGASGIASWADSTSINSSVQNIFRLQGFPMWNSQTIREFILPYIINPFYTAVSFLFPIGAFSAFLFVKNQKERHFILLFYLIALLGIFFSSGTHPPFGYIYSFLLRFVPGFAIFRTPFFKFEMLVTFSYAVLIGFSVLKGCVYVFHKRSRLFLAMLGIAALWSFYHLPFFLGDFFVYNRPFTNKSKLPEYVSQMSDYINTHVPHTDRVLLVPDVDASKADGYSWGYWSPDPLPRMTIQTSTVSSAQNPPEIVSQIYEALYARDVETFLRLMGNGGIPYILFRNDTVTSQKTSEKEAKQILHNFVQSLPSVEVVKRAGEWTLYRVSPPSLLPIIHALDITQTPLTITAPCARCLPSQLRADSALVAIPPVYILPGSPLYGWLRWTEQVDNGDTDALILTNGRRVAEFLRLYSRDLHETNILLARSLVQEIEHNILQIQHNLEKRSDSQEYIAERQKVYLHLRSVNRAMKEVLPYITEQELRRVYLVMGDAIRHMEQNQPGGQLRANYTITVPETGVYTYAPSSSATVSATIGDIQVVRPHQTLTLSQGTHQALVEELSSSIEYQEVALPFGEANTRSLSVPKNSSFLLNFRYTLSGPPIDIQITAITNNEQIPMQTISLPTTDEWSDMSVPIYSQFPTDMLQFSLNACCYSSIPSTVALDRFVVHASPPHSLYFSKIQDRASSKPLPSVHFTKINPTKYTVSITDAQAPYTLVLNHQFDSRWRLVMDTSENSAPGHTTVNGFANGWNINKTGTYTMTIEYWPQSLVYRGGFITLFAVILGGVVFVAFRRNDEIH